jgi:hypothetical protein
VRPLATRLAADGHLPVQGRGVPSRCAEDRFKQACPSPEEIAPIVGQIGVMVDQLAGIERAARVDGLEVSRHHFM